MRFCDALDQQMQQLHCTARVLCQKTGLSPATLSRYRSGERVPEPDSDPFRQLCATLADLRGCTQEEIAAIFLACEDVRAVDFDRLRENFNLLLSVMELNIAALCRSTNYDVSTVFRFRSGQRRLSDPEAFASSAASYVAHLPLSDGELRGLAELLGVDQIQFLSDPHREDRIRTWLLSGQGQRPEEVSSFLSKLDEFDLNEYIKAIHFDRLKVPTTPFQLPSSRTASNLREMMDIELDFLKGTVLSRSREPVIMYSDMPMEEMSRDPNFPKKWMFGMAMLLKKGLHLTMIHNVDRPFYEMMLGLESWIPLYMTGLVTPYYLRRPQNEVFLHFLKVSGSVALTGEAIAGHHAEGRYYLTNNRAEVAYYRRRANALLGCAHPLMDIYRAERAADWNAFLRADMAMYGQRRTLLSTLPLYTMDAEFLHTLLARRELPEQTRREVEEYAVQSRQNMEDFLSRGTLLEQVPCLSREEFAQYPLTLSLSGMFCETDILYTYEEYMQHLAQTKAYARSHPNYRLEQTATGVFRNLQITLHEGKWAMVSKGRAPAIHFVIRHPRLRKALEGFMPPVVENQKE